MRGITVTNYLVSGNPEGIVLSYISNWNGQAVKIPRNIFAETSQFAEVKKPGIYFLFGSNSENPDDKWVYIGEANNIYDRLKQHLSNDSSSFYDFDTVVCFSSKDENLTVSHTKYLEKAAITHVASNSTYKLQNGTSGTSVSLPRMAIDEMDTFFDNMQILLPTMGFNLFGNKAISSQPSVGKKIAGHQFILKVGNINATAKLNVDSFEVLGGSQATKTPTKALSNGYRSIRDTLIERGILVEDNGKLKFINSYEFSSPSTAAAVILGYSVNGRVTWKTKDEKTLKEYEESLINMSPDSI